MRVAKVWSGLLALALMAPGALAGQERRGEESRGFMGIGFEWDEENAREARVAQVVPGSGAATAGVRRGDVVLRINGDPATEEAVDRLREELKAGDTVRLRLRREGRELDQAVVAGRAPERRVTVRGEGDDDVITLRIPREEIRVRMDTLRRHLENLHTRIDSLHGRVEVLNGDSNVVVFRMERDRRRMVHPREGAEIRVFRGDSARRRIMVDSVLVIHGDSLHRTALRELERIEAFPFHDLDPEVPFYMELGRRGVAGAELTEMNSGLARYFRTNTGLLVLKVSENTPLARAGVEAGDVIVRAGGGEIRSVAELRRAMTAASREGKLHLQVVRQGSTRSVEMQWEPVRRRTVVPARGDEARVRAERARARAEQERVRAERERAPN